MHIKDLYLADGFPCKTVSGELHGTCPSCGHKSHFVIRKEGKKGDQQCQELGSFFCRNCDISGKTSGNAIAYLMAVRNMSYVDACNFVGYNLPDRPHNKESAQRQQRYSLHRQARQQASHSNPPTPPAPSSQSVEPAYIWYPEKTEHPDWVYDQNKWAEHAIKFVAACHEHILARPSALDWFASRGVPLDMVKRMCLGFNPGQSIKGIPHQNSIKTCSGWGMSPVNDDGTVAKFFVLPAGLVIPCWSGSEGSKKIVRIQIRKLDDQSKWVVKGSVGYSGAHMILNPGKSIALIVENERDGMAIAWACPDVTVIPLGSAKGKPCEADHAELREKKLILLALDPDRTSQSNRDLWARNYPDIPCPEYALGIGVAAVDWWYAYYPQSFPWIIEGYGDPGEAIQAGIDIADWVKRGIAYYMGEGTKKEEESKEVESNLHIFCRLLHQYGKHFIPAPDIRSWSWAPPPIGASMYDVPSAQIDGLMFKDDVAQYLSILWWENPGPWTGIRIWKFFNP